MPHIKYIKCGEALFICIHVFFHVWNGFHFAPQSERKDNKKKCNNKLFNWETLLFLLHKRLIDTSESIRLDRME